MERVGLTFLLRCLPGGTDGEEERVMVRLSRSDAKMITNPWTLNVQESQGLDFLGDPNLCISRQG